MRKTASAALLLSLLFASLPPAAPAQTRARRVPATQPAAQPAQQPTAPDAGDAQQRRNAPTIRSAGSSGVSTTPVSSRQGTARAQSNAPEEVDEDEVINVNTTLVTIPVSVRDRDGRYMPNLVKEDFRVYEDNVEQRVEYFATTEQPFTVALILDTSGSTRFRIDEIQDAASAFVGELRPADRVMVVSFDDEVRVLSEPTGDRNRLRSAIRSTRQGNGTRLYDAVDMVVNQWFPRIQGRKAIVLFTDGVDTSSRRASYQSNMQDAEELDGLIYTVQYDTYVDSRTAGGGGGGGWPGGGRGTGSTVGDILAGIILGGNVRIGRGGGGRRGGGGNWPGGGGTNCVGCSREDYERGDRYLADIARLTGARRYRADSSRDLTGAFSLIAEELRRQYSLGYYPSRQAQAGERRRIRVRVMRPDLVVQARDSYITGQPSAPATASQQNRDQQQQQSGQRPTIRRWPLAEVPQR
jgi:Ca-activated chloride channel family protein